jgi:hypothetical protein
MTNAISEYTKEFTVTNLVPDLASGQRTFCPWRVSVEVAAQNYGASLTTGEQLVSAQLFAYDQTGQTVAMTNAKILSLTNPTRLSFNFNVWTTRYYLSGGSGKIFAIVLKNPYGTSTVAQSIPLKIRLEYVVSHDSVNQF